MLADRIAAAAGRRPAELVFRKARVVDVLRHRIVLCDVAVTDGVIVGLGAYEGETVIDAEGQYLLPSLIEAHAHIESSMLTPGEYARTVAAWGVTTVLADPHEIANVCGEEGVAFLQAASAGLPVDIRYLLPSCVPASGIGTPGETLDAEVTSRLLRTGRFAGLGEMMNYVGVTEGDPEVLAKLEAADFIDGHAPLLSGKALCAYACAGIRTDHECTTAEEVLEKVGLGLYVQLRFGSSAQDLPRLVGAITPYTLRRLLLCTDDRTPEDLVEHGSIAACLAEAVRSGVDPIDAVTMATLNPAECYGLGRVGAVAPGYQADLLLTPDLSFTSVSAVYRAGMCIAEQGRALFPAPSVSPASRLLHTLHLPSLTPADFEQPFSRDEPVIQVRPGSLITQAVHCASAEGLNRCAVLERHHGTGRIGKAWIAGMGLSGGAIAQSIGHDAHHVTVVGDRPEDMLLAVRALGTEGGLSVVTDGRLRALLPLPIAGLLSDRPAAEVAALHKEALDALRSLNCADGISPFMLLSFLSLPVIPYVKLTDQGLFDVERQQFIR